MEASLELDRCSCYAEFGQLALLPLLCSNGQDLHGFIQAAGLLEL